MEQNNKLGEFLIGILTEARREDLVYTEKKSKGVIDKVSTTLSGSDSGRFTKLATRYARMKKAKEKLDEMMSTLNADIKEQAVELFDAQDEVLTRIIETSSVILTIGKRESDAEVEKTTVNYAAIIKQITELVPELTEKLEEIIAANTTVEKEIKVAKSPQLRIAVKESDQLDEGVLNDVKQLISALRRKFKDVLRSMKLWGRSYDKSLAEIKAQLGVK